MNGLDGREEQGPFIGGSGFFELSMPALCAMRGVNSGVDFMARAGPWPGPARMGPPGSNAARAFCWPNSSPGPSGPMNEGGIRDSRF
jgi:hypothetical protein